MRAVLDPNVLISAILSQAGPPAQILRAWIDGSFELVVSPFLLAELRRALTYPKLRRRVSADEAESYADWLERSATIAMDPVEPLTLHSPDPADDYLLALAASTDATLVSGDQHVLSMAVGRPILSPADFLKTLG